MEKWEWLVDTFTVIGMVVCILVTLIALAWVVCYAVKLLVKTFSVKVDASYDIIVEDINKKKEAKKIRKEIKRNKQTERKLELLNMKEESRDKVHEMKKQKLADKLEVKENAEAKKMFVEPVAKKTVSQKGKEEHTEAKKEKPESKTAEKQTEVLEEKKTTKKVEKVEEPEKVDETLLVEEDAE